MRFFLFFKIPTYNCSAIEEFLKSTLTTIILLKTFIKTVNNKMASERRITNDNLNFIAECT